MIEVTHLSREFQAGGRTILAVDDLSFTVAPGEVYGLLGPNGAGKTTTLRMVLGLVPPSTGDAAVNGQSVCREPNEVKRRIGLVSASAGLYPMLTPRETLAYFGELYDVPPDLARERTARLSTLLNLGPFLNQRCGTLSTGQKQRVTLARALIHDPPVMLLDEPTRGLDVIGVHVIFEYIASLRAEGRAIVLCTHRLEEASQVCDRMGLLHRGRLRHEGAFSQLQSLTGRGTLYEMFLDLLQDDAPVASGAAAHG